MATIGLTPEERSRIELAIQRYRIGKRLNIREIADRAGVTYNAVYTVVRALCEVGHIERRETNYGDRTTVYFYRIPSAGAPAAPAIEYTLEPEPTPAATPVQAPNQEALIKRIADLELDVSLLKRALLAR